MVVVFVVQEKYNLPPVNRETKKKTGAHTKGDEPRNANAEERVNVTHNLLEYSHRGGRPNIAARFPFDTRTSTVNKVVGGWLLPLQCTLQGWVTDVHFQCHSKEVSLSL